MNRAAPLEVVLCDCPERPPGFPLESLEALLEERQIPVRRFRRLCRLASYCAFLDYCADGPGRNLLIGACSETLVGDLLEASLRNSESIGTFEVVDLKHMPDPEAFLGECLARLGSGPGQSFTCPGKPEGRSCLKRLQWRRREPDDPDRVLVIGGGVGGCQAALDLATAGIPVTLVEADATLGGNMARLDKTFPTLDCSICILGPKLVETANRAEITVLTQSRVVSVSGRPGRFQVEILHQARHVDMAKCSGCGACMDICPVIIPSTWNLGLKPAKAIGIMFEQAVPLRATIDKEYCIECGLCEQACERDAISLVDQSHSTHLRVGAIVLAHGARTFNAGRLGPYGYGHYPQVITNLEFERLVCATGPTQGRLITPSGTHPRRVAFIQCAGSRNERYLPYCSGFCCTASIKEAMLVLEHCPDAEVTIFFNDIRAAGKGFEALYLRAIERGVRFVKAIASSITRTAGGDRVAIRYYPPGNAGIRRLEVDLAVLAVGLEPGTDDIAYRFSHVIPMTGQHGFYRDRHPWAAPLDSPVGGIFLAGGCHGPRDITQTVAEASGAAARAVRFLHGKAFTRTGLERCDQELPQPTPCSRTPDDSQAELEDA